MKSLRLRVTPILLLVFAACAGPGAGASPDAATPAATAAALTEDEAVRLVLAENDRFGGLQERDPEAVGQGSFYEVSEADGGGYRVDVEIGWGDCPAGCIYKHHWVYEVDPDRRVELVEESGDPLEEGGSGVDDY